VPNSLAAAFLASASVPIVWEPPGLGLGLQFGLQFTSVRPSSPEYAHAAQPAARTPMNHRERAPLKLLIRGFGVRVPGGAPAKTCQNGTVPWNQSWNHRALLRYGGRMEAAGTCHIERLPSGSYRVHVYAGTGPLTGRRLRYRHTARVLRVKAEPRTHGNSEVQLAQQHRRSGWMQPKP